jgi:hypothetical protein
MYVPLSEYVRRIPITMVIAPPGYPNHRRIGLTEEVQQLMRRLLKFMPDPETNMMCFLELKAENVIVDTQSGRPFLHAAFFTDYDYNLAQMNYASVEKIFRQTIFNGALASLPPDLQELLSLMRTEGHLASYAIQHHCSLVWATDKNELFTRLYNYSHHILQRQDYLLYEDVMNNLDFPTNWNFQIRQNPYLDMFYRGSTYYPVGPNAGKEVLRFKRNTYGHCLEHAWDMAKEEQIYDEAQLGEMMETVLPLVLHSFQVALDGRGLLRNIALESFFH